MSTEENYVLKINTAMSNKPFFVKITDPKLTIDRIMTEAVSTLRNSGKPLESQQLDTLYKSHQMMGTNGIISKGAIFSELDHIVQKVGTQKVVMSEVNLVAAHSGGSDKYPKDFPVGYIKEEDSPFVKAMLKTSNQTLTENGAVTNKSTLSPLLDFFALGGALRTRSAEDKRKLFLEAFSENALLATKCLFYFRDIRGGQGERQTFRDIIKICPMLDPDPIMKNLHLIPEYGRWDDFFELKGTKYEDQMISLIKTQLSIDISSDRPSLLAKWMPSINTSSKKKRALAKWFTIKLLKNDKSYRKMLSILRAKIKVVEREMCSKKWDQIQYDHVPSQASKRYRKAFKKHDETRYTIYIQACLTGEKKIKAQTLYPYQLVEGYLNRRESKDDTIEALWKNLPNYCVNGESGIVVADTSSSMNGQPITVAVSLAIYFAERNKGPFQDVFISFSHEPKFHTLKGKSLWEKIQVLDREDWSQNTDLIAVFDLILETAKHCKVLQADMPTKLYIVSDMEFDAAADRSTNFDAIRQKYKDAGYVMPSLTFWNVDARHNQSPVTKDDKNVFLISGLSPSIFKSAMTSKAVNPVDLMLDVLNGDRYKAINI